jgi:jumonji domain-containing protein 2
MGLQERWEVRPKAPPLGEAAPPQTFRPTEAELADWEGLVAAMERRGAHRAGMARLVLPEGWVPRARGYQLAGVQATVRRPIRQHIRPTAVKGAFEHCAEPAGFGPLSAAEYQELTCRPEHTAPTGSPHQLERSYWAQHSDPAAQAPVYGADVEATLFDPRLKVFNLSKLNSRPESVLAHDSGPRLAGIHTPYLFLGMWRSTFSWHIEDMVRPLAMS